MIKRFELTEDGDDLNIFQLTTFRQTIVLLCAALNDEL